MGQRQDLELWLQNSFMLLIYTLQKQIRYFTSKNHRASVLRGGQVGGLDLNKEEEPKQRFME